MDDMAHEGSTASGQIEHLEQVLGTHPRARLAQLPTPIHRLPNFGAQIGIPELWIKRDDLTGLEGGGNKTRKLEFLVGDALRAGADTLVTIGAIQSNHTRQTAAAAARAGLKCALLHFGWTEDAGPGYRSVGNVLLSSLMGAQLFVDDTPRPIEDQGPLDEFCDYLAHLGHRPYPIPGGASEHRLGSLGYMACAAEIERQCLGADFGFDFIVHCTGSSSTQSGLLAGYAALGTRIQVVGISDDDETAIKQRRVHDLANSALAECGIDAVVDEREVHVVAGDPSAYGKADEQTFAMIRLLAATEGLAADPVYEGKAVRGLQALAAEGFFPHGSRVLLMHLGGTPALHAYASQFGSPHLEPFRGGDISAAPPGR
jgi:1-aminocyclopropane-1-carboxylate deaminase